MKKFDRVLKQLSDLYEFNRRLKQYTVKKKEPADTRSPKDTPTRPSRESSR
ncbi:MAG: hypothetical protein Kow0099_22560 [Candidatus Abyssubacteria bacterium]